MPTKKVGFKLSPCLHPEHNRSLYTEFMNQVYEHICPGCNKKITFTVSGAIW